MMWLYIDPGTGSMLFAAVMGIAAAAVYFLQQLWMKLRFLLTGGRVRGGAGARSSIVVYNESGRYWTLFRPILEELERRGAAGAFAPVPAEAGAGAEVEYWTMDPEDPALSMSWQYIRCVFIGEGNRGFARLNLMRADICLATTPGLEVYQWKRSRNVRCYVHVFHMINEGTGYRMFGLDFYDAILLTGAFQERYIRRAEELRHLPPKELEVVGVPYMDELLKRHEAESGTERRNAAAGGAPTVLLAPSWGVSGIFSRFGERMLEALKATGYHIIVRPHPQTVTSEKELLRPLQEKFPDDGQLEWNYDSDNFDALDRSDILISDYSGVVYDFAMVFDRPVIYADVSYDPAPYDNAWLVEGSPAMAAREGQAEGAPGSLPWLSVDRLWRFEKLREFGVRLDPADFDRIGEVIDAAIADRSLSEARQRVKAEAWQYIGHSAERTVDYLLRKRESLRTERPGEEGLPMERGAGEEAS